MKYYQLVFAFLVGLFLGSSVGISTVDAGNQYTNFMRDVVALLEKIEINTRK
jgi:hypothetical protein